MRHTSIQMAAVVLAAALMAGAAVAGDITIDCAKQHQTITGFGTAVYLYGSVPLELYPNEAFRKMYVQDLGASMVRAALPERVLPAEVADWKDISHKNFIIEGDGRPQRLLRANLEAVAAFCKLNPEIKFTPTVWSPPGWMKTNNKASGGGSLRKDRYQHYAKYLAEWCLFMKDRYGVPIYAIGVQNEPYFVEPYDSCVYRDGAEYAAMVKAVGKMFADMKIDTKIFGPEDMTKFPDRVLKTYIKPVMADPEAAKYYDIFATHGYSDGIESSGGIRDNNALWKAIQPYGKPLWMTETGAGWTAWEGVEKTHTTGKKKGQKYQVPGALDGIGYEMHASLAYGNISAWLLWQAAGAPSAGAHHLIDTRPAGQDKMDPVPTKKYYVAKHYYRFIRPGAVRVEAGPDGPEDVYVTAYTHAKNGTLTVELLNLGKEDRAVTLNIKGGPKVESLETYRTTGADGMDCKALDATAVKDGSATLTLPARSITTLYSGKGDELFKE